LDQRRRDYDVPLLAAAFALAVIGAVLVWAATKYQYGDQYVLRHLLNVVITALLCWGASRLDLRLLRLAGSLIYLASLGGLGLVLVAGATINGAHAWLRLGGGFELQPSEFAKLGLIVGMAVMLGGEPVSARLCGSVREAAESGSAPCFFESFLWFASRPIPFGGDYGAWRVERAEAMAAGREISYCGRP
jgi:rod shape determining protein RodA